MAKRKKATKITEGVCKLTGARGKFVDSHLIPKALTRPEEPGLPFLQGGSGKYAERRWSSWYDPQLVTAEGEKILAEYDDWAISFLRSKRLVWSGWGPMREFTDSTHHKVPGTPYGKRRVSVEQPDMLRLFILSLLWRAAASTLREFAEVELPAGDLSVLGTMLQNKDPGSIDFYPATLIQLSTVGIAHNMVPIADVKRVPAISDERSEEPGRNIPIFRFYFEGLIIHVHRYSSDDGYAASLPTLMVGAGSELDVTTITYEASFEHSNLMTVMSETIYERPQRSKKQPTQPSQSGSLRP